MQMKALILILSFLGAGILLCQSMTPETPIDPAKEIIGSWVLVDTDNQSEITPRDKSEATPHIIEFLSDGKGKAYAAYNTKEQTHTIRYSIDKAEKDITLFIAFYNFDGERRSISGHTVYHVSFKEGLLYLKSQFSSMHLSDIGVTKVYKRTTHYPRTPDPFNPHPIVPIE